MVQVGLARGGGVCRRQDIGNDLSDSTRAGVFLWPVALYGFVIRAGGLFLMNVLQELDTVNKFGLSGKHHQVDGVIVFLTLEASGQIGFRIYGGIKTVADRAKKTKTPLCHPARDAQGFFDEHPNADLVTQAVKLTGRKALVRHIRLPGLAWVSD